MSLSRFADVPMSARDGVFQYSRARATAATIAILSGSAGLIFLGRSPGAVLAYYVAAVLLIGLILMQTFVRARFRPTNWLVRATDDGLFVQFRSYLNYRFPAEHVTVAFIPYRDLRAVRVIRERRQIPDRDLPSPRVGAVTEQRRTVVELELKRDDESLTHAVDEELARCFGRGSRDDNLRTRYRHAPVRMTSASTMQLEWKVTAGPGSLLTILRAHGVATGVGEDAFDYQQIANQSRDDQVRRLVELLETGKHDRGD
jgi:hypothetical protein